MLYILVQLCAQHPSKSNNRITYYNSLNAFIWSFLLFVNIKKEKITYKYNKCCFVDQPVVGVRGCELVQETFNKRTSIRTNPNVIPHSVSAFVWVDDTLDCIFLLRHKILYCKFYLEKVVVTIWVIKLLVIVRTHSQL